jgi:hypothetical protein
MTNTAVDITITRLEELKDHAQDPINQSAMKDLLHCPRLYLWSFRWGLVPRRRAMSDALGTGTYFHALAAAGMENVGMVRKTLLDDQIKVAMEAGWDEDMMGDRADLVARMQNNFNFALMMYTLLQEKYPDNPGMKCLFREQKLNGNVFGLEIHGTPDSVWEALGTGHIWIRDYKQTGRDFALMTAGEAWGIQSRIYRILVEQTIGKPVYGFIYDRVRKPTIKFCNKDKTWDDYLKRCRQWYIENDVKAVESKAVMFKEEPLNSEVLGTVSNAEWFRDLEVGNIDDFQKDVTCAQCSSYGRLCPYIRLCQAPSEMLPAIISSEYQLKETQDDTADESTDD